MEEGRIGRVSTSRRFTTVIAGANFRNRALLIFVVPPTVLLKLVMLCLLRRGKLVIFCPGVLPKRDMGTSIDFSLAWGLGSTFLGPRMAEPIGPYPS